MANSSIPITAGTGTDVDTRTTTTDGDHRQVVVLGDPATDAGVAPVDATNGLTVDMVDDYTRQVGRMKVVNDAGTVVDPVAQVSHDAADSGDPIKVGFKATDQLSDLTAVAQDDRTDGYAGLDGAQIVRPHAPLGDCVDGTASATTTSATSVIAAGGSGIFTYITSIQAANTSSTDTTITIDSGTTAKAVFSVPADGGITVEFPTPLTPNTSNEAWTFESEDAVTTMYVTMTGFRSAI